MAYVVKAAAVVVRVDDARHEVYLYRGAPLPAEALPESVEHLVAMGLVVEEEPVAVAADPAPDEGEGDGSPDFSGMNLDELRSYAAEHDIDLGGATRKDDVLAALNAAK